MHFTNSTSTSVLNCPPVTQPIYTTTYETVLLAACETSSWMATYTVVETCHGDKVHYVTPTTPPGFVVTTISCPSCSEHEIVITCPGVRPTGVGKPNVQIDGNGVTATITASVAPAPAKGGHAAPTSGAVWPVNKADSGSKHGCGGSCGVHGNGTIGKPPMPVTGTAASLRRSLIVGAGLAFMAGPFFLL